MNFVEARARAAEDGREDFSPMRRSSSTPSISQIATKAGVSRAAVSMALRNHPRIPAATRARIQAVAAKLGWRPNPLLAQAMSEIRSGQPTADRVTLAWVTAHRHRDSWRRVPFFLRCFEGASERASSAGYRLEHFWLGDAEGSAERLSDILIARGIVGVVVGPLPQPGTLALRWDKFSVVTTAYSLTTPRVHRAADNHCESARLAVSRLHAAGCRRIGLALSTDYDRRVNGLWSAGYLLQMQNEGLAKFTVLHRPTQMTEAELVAWVRAQRLDAVMGADPRIPGWLRAAGVRMPADLAYADLDLAAPTGKVAGIYQDASGIGASAIDLLAGQLMRHERGLPEKPKVLLIESRWIEGATVPRAVAESAEGGELREVAPDAPAAGYVAPARPVPFD